MMQDILDALSEPGEGDRTDYAPVGDVNLEVYGNALKGVASATAGLPGDIEGIAKLLMQLKQGYYAPEAISDGTFPDTTAIGETMGADTESPEFMGGSMFGLDPFSKFGAAASILAVPLKKLKLKPKDLVKITSPTGKRKFAQKQSEARQKMSDKDKAQVDAFDPEGHSGDVFMNKEGTAGFSMSDDGYIGHLFKHPDAPVSGTMDATMTKARAEGATELEAFDTYLAPGYMKRGAVEKRRAGWDPDYATDEIIKAFGDEKPDFVTMGIGGQLPEYKHSQILGPRKQELLPRATHTPTGRYRERPESIDAAMTPENKDFIRSLIQKGKDEGADEWYHSGGILDAFVKERGPQQGMKAFDEMVDVGAIMSPKSFPWKEMQRGSVIRNRMKQGQNVRDLDAGMFPPGYGHLATTTAHRSGMNRWLDTGIVGDPQAPMKTPSYAEAGRGNYAPWVVDTHDIKSTFMNTPLAGKSTISQGELAHLEPELLKIADEFGLQGAEAQSSKWVGGGEYTNLKDMRNKTAIFNQRIAKTAEYNEISEEEALKRWINGDIVLRMAVGGVGTGVVAGAMMEDEQEEMY